jgi:predicted permease
MFSVLPALHVSRGDLGVTLTGSGGQSGTSGRHRAVRSLLVIAEMALALVLLVGAALLIRTFVALRTVDRGFEQHQMLTVRMSLTDPRFATTRAVEQLIRDGVQRINSVPGVVSTAAAGSLPLVSNWLTSFSIVGRPPERPPRAIISERIVSPSYFTATAIPVIRGRAFTDRDDGAGLPVAIINETMARRWWPEGDPLNDRLVAFPGLLPGDEPARYIVGVVGDVRDGLALNPGPHPTIYMPLSQLPDRQTSGMMRDEPLAWIVRTRGEPYTAAAAVQHELQQLSGGAPITQMRSIDDVMTNSNAGTHFNMVALAVFGGSALVLAAIGVYGVMAYVVQQRTHEIGVRLALGADGRQVRNMLLTRGMALALSGVAIGLAAAFGLAHVLTAFIYGVTSHDWVAFVAAPLVLSAVALVAVWLPVRRATKVDPVIALRCE